MNAGVFFPDLEIRYFLKRKNWEENFESRKKKKRNIGQAFWDCYYVGGGKIAGR